MTGTAENILTPIIAEEAIYPEGGVRGGFSIAVNPEFLREGSAVKDSLNPYKLVLEITGSDRALTCLATLYEPIVLGQ